MADILFLAHRVPWPPNRGDKIRSYNFLKKLIEVAPVHLICFADSEEEAVETDIVRDNLASCTIIRRDKPQWKAGLEALMAGKAVSLTSFGSKDLSAAVNQTIDENEIECIFTFSGQMAQYVPVDFAGRFVMDFADVDSAKFESYGKSGSGPMTWINRREGKLLKSFEDQIGRMADQSLFVSEAEAVLFGDRSGIDIAKISAIGNGIDLHFYDPEKIDPVVGPSKGPLIVFTGQMDYRPNVEAVESFANEAMPSILNTYSDACFAIVGRAPTESVQSLHGRNGTIVTGGVPDVRNWLKAADVVVAPLRIARGIQNKVLEAMAMEKPVVASTAAAEGIDAKHGEHLLIAKDVTEEAQFVKNLFGDRAMAQDIGKSAKELIHSHYSWNNQLSELHRICGFAADRGLEAAE